MAPEITVNPNPTAPGVMCRVLGTGFDKRVFVSIVFDGVGSTTKFKPNGQGKFDVGLDVVSTKPDGTYVVQARKHGTTTVLASTNLVVKKVIVVPPPVDNPPAVTVGPVVSNITTIAQQSHGHYQNHVRARLIMALQLHMVPQRLKKLHLIILLIPSR